MNQLILLKSSQGQGRDQGRELILVKPSQGPGRDQGRAWEAIESSKPGVGRVQRGARISRGWVPWAIAGRHFGKRRKARSLPFAKTRLRP